MLEPMYSQLMKQVSSTIFNLILLIMSGHFHLSSILHHSFVSEKCRNDFNRMGCSFPALLHAPVK